MRIKKTITLLSLIGNAIILNAQVGIGTPNPTQKLHVEGNTRLNGNVYDGANQPGAAGQVLSSNGTKVQWANNTATIPSVSAVFPKTGSNLRWDETAYTGTTLTLPPGKWSVNVILLIDNNLAASNNAVGWFRTTFSDSATSSTSSTDILGSPLASGSLIGPSIYGLITGTIIISNTSGANKTYYLWKLFTTFSGPSSGSWLVDDFARGIAGEDQIIAFPMN